MKEAKKKKDYHLLQSSELLHAVFRLYSFSLSRSLSRSAASRPPLCFDELPLCTPAVLPRLFAGSFLSDNIAPYTSLTFASESDAEHP
jgi:hypothetical protein